MDFEKRAARDCVGVFGCVRCESRRGACARWPRGRGAAAARRRGCVSVHAILWQTDDCGNCGRGGAARAGAPPARPRGCAATAPRCQRARAAPAGRKQAISALQFKVLVRGRASCASAARAAGACQQLVQTLEKLCVFTGRRAVLLRRFQFDLDKQPKLPSAAAVSNGRKIGL